MGQRPFLPYCAVETSGATTLHLSHSSLNSNHKEKGDLTRCTNYAAASHRVKNCRHPGGEHIQDRSWSVL